MVMPRPVSGFNTVRIRGLALFRDSLLARQAAVNRWGNPQAGSIPAPGADPTPSRRLERGTSRWSCRQRPHLLAA